MIFLGSVGVKLLSKVLSGVFLLSFKKRRSAFYGYFGCFFGVVYYYLVYVIAPFGVPVKRQKWVPPFRVRGPRSFVAQKKKRA